MEASTGTDDGSAEKEAAGGPVDMRFNFDDDHCWYDVDQMLAGIAGWVIDLALTGAEPEQLEEYGGYEWEHLADCLGQLSAAEDDEARADALDHAAEQIRRSLHRGNCDCSQFAFDFFAEEVNDVLRGLGGQTSPRIIGVYDNESDDEPALAGEAVTWEELVSGLYGRGGYDGVRLEYDPTTGTGSVAFSDRGWGPDRPIYVVTDPARVELIELFYERTDCYDNARLVRQIHGLDVTAELIEAVHALLDSDEVTGRCGYGQFDLCNAFAVDLFNELRDSGVLGMRTADLHVLAKLARTWVGSLTDLVAVLDAAAA